MRGVVTEFNRKRHIGVIKVTLSEEQDKFVSCNEQDLKDVRYLKRGDLVDFTLGKNNKAREIFLITGLI